MRISMAFSSMSFIVISVCLDSASSLVNMALKYGDEAHKMTLCARIRLEPTFSTTSQRSPWRLNATKLSRMARPCLSDVLTSLGRVGEQSRITSIVFAVHAISDAVSLTTASLFAGADTDVILRLLPIGDVVLNLLFLFY